MREPSDAPGGRCPEPSADGLPEAGEQDPPEPSSTSGAASYPPDEEQQVVDRLEALGYLG